MSNENKIRILYVQPGKYPEERFVANELRPLQQLVGGQRVIFLPSAISKKEHSFSLEIFRHMGHLHHLLARACFCRFTFENRKTPNISRNCSLSGRFWTFLFDMRGFTMVGNITLSLMVGKPAICCFVAIEKRHIAAALLLCPEDGTGAVQLSVVPLICFPQVDVFW